uniref:Dynein light chain n=1 Tax=Davidia involucrata TaxID=16924 RepID=A0A5B6YHB1_DAVIN
MSVSAIIENTSSTSFIKSNRRHRRTAAEKDNKSDEVKKLSKKESKRKEFLEGHDMKRSQDCELKESHEGFDLKIPLPGGRRRSFCNSQTELADFLACAGVKVVSVDMPPFMQVHAVDCARKACDSLEKFAAKTLAFTLKKEFDGVYGPAWHCIVGTSFGSFVTHSVGGFMYFSMDHKLYILLFKTTVQRAD